LPGAPPLPLREVADSDHPRVRRARRYRPQVRIWTTDGGVLVVGRGLAGRWEAAIEVEAPQRGRGLGRSLARAARHLVPDDRPVWAQVAPGNAASVRAFLAAGYRPVGAEVLLVP
jgi:GNAT superfamily N-acetyltransferase